MISREQSLKGSYFYWIHGTLAGALWPLVNSFLLGMPVLGTFLYSENRKSRSTGILVIIVACDVFIIINEL